MPSLSRQWRSLDELANEPSFVARAMQEFPGLSESLSASQDRRQHLRLLAAAFTMAGLGGCDWTPEGQLIPAVKTAANIVPGLPSFYATAHVLNGYATGILVKHFMKRPIKVEGNPRHPASLGATDVFAQAQVLEFYDPGRSWALSARGLPAPQQSLDTALLLQRAKIAASRGAGFRILTGAITSPTLAAELDALLLTYPEARWTQWEPISRHNIADGAILAYGQPVEMVPKLDAADVVLAIDSDLLSSAPGHLRFARDFASRRNPVRSAKMSRVYAIEPAPTLIGAAADHRFIAGPPELRQIMMAIAAGILGTPPPSKGPAWVDAVIADLMANRGRALVHAGPDQPPEMHALAHTINEELGARGSTLDLIEPVAHSLSGREISLAGLAEEMQRGLVSTLLIMDSNPVYTAPGTLGFSEALKHVDFSLTLTLWPNETSSVTNWAVPMAHSWEAWSDACAYDGTASIMQPQALLLYNGTSIHTMLALFLEASPQVTLDLVKSTWQNRFGRISRGLGMRRLRAGPFRIRRARQPACPCGQMPAGSRYRILSSSN